MAGAYSIDLRERVLAVVRAGASIRVVGKRFEVAPSTVAKWSRLERETGSVAPRARTLVREPTLKRHGDWLLGVLRGAPHTTLHALKARLQAERGVRVSHDTVWRFLVGAGWSFKKKPGGGRARPA